MIEDDIRLVLDEYNSSFITYDLEPAIYTFENLSQAFLSFLQPEYPGSSTVSDFEFDDITKKTKLIVGSGKIAIRFDENSLFSTVLGCNAHWDYKHYNDYISQKTINLTSTNKKHL